MEKKEKKGFFSSLFTSKGCNCGMEIVEASENTNSDKQTSEKKNEEDKNKSLQQNNQVRRGGCGC
ncbi:MAG TPA: hypothetical protein DDZ96_14960 [Porphyromonadaceae bacterium]|jgi:hypothetical protein|nr:hypothetical protein [Porphyromonadaceae bacterium]HBX19277.1 hypothetical protein [Porphyromonadaceae bacterium]HCM20448.1 hypothetical protein [Porphyromonadaceae bacterium]